MAIKYSTFSEKNNHMINKDKIFIIAEIGKNFIQTEDDRPVEEYLSNAKDLIKAAHEAGADAVKFQTHVLEDEFLDMDVTSPHFKGSDRKRWITRNETATPIEFWDELKRYCDELGIVFFSTPMSRKAAQKINHLVDIWKVGSGDIMDFVLLDYLASTKKPIIFSAGMSTLEEIDKVVEFLQKRGAEAYLLHCVSKYPCPPEELNLNTIKLFQERYDIPIGFSDHSIGYESAVAAAQLGAKIIEKHFSFSRDLWGSDHKVSMTPDEFKAMVDLIRGGASVNLSNYGTRTKVLQEGEDDFRPLFRKSLMFAKDLPAGSIIGQNDVYAMRPQKFARGLPSEEYENIIGKITNKDVNKFDPITVEQISHTKKPKRKICFVITSKIHYSRNKLILDELTKRDDVELQIIVGGSALLDKYGDTLTLLEKDGYKCNAKIVMTLDGGSPISMAKTTGIGITEFATALDNLNPDLVLVRGDRYEVLSAAIAATYLNIPVAHIEGGDITGNIDESVRHAITKLAHIHFATNENSRERILRMGENPDYVFNVGSPDIEFVAKNDYTASNELVNQIGVGEVVDIQKPFIMVMQHPVTTEFGKNREYITQTLKAVDTLQIPAIWFWPNVDAGTDELSKGIRAYREINKPKYIRFIKYLPPEQFLGLLKECRCLVG